MKIITDSTNINKDSWDYFVSSHPNGNVFQTYEFFRIYKTTSGYKPIVVAILDDNNQICGILVGVIQSILSGFLGRLSSRAIVMGGPLINDSNSQICEKILLEFEKLCKYKVIYIQFRNLWNIVLYKDIFKKQKFYFEDHLDILFDLQKETSVLWENIHPTRKKQINRGKKRGVKIEIKNSLSDNEFFTCYNILKQVYKEAKLPLPKEDFFQNAIKIFRKKNIFYTALALYESEIIGFRFFLCFNNLIYDWYAGSLREHYDKYPNDVLPYEVILWGSQNRYNVFDFGGAGKPNIPYGVRDYKLKFGGGLVNYGRYQKTQFPFIMKISKIVFLIWRKIK